VGSWKTRYVTDEEAGVRISLDNSSEAFH
jgi:hypothetical protein